MAILSKETLKRSSPEAAGRKPLFDEGEVDSSEVQKGIKDTRDNYERAAEAENSNKAEKAPAAYSKLAKFLYRSQMLDRDQFQVKDQEKETLLAGLSVFRERMYKDGLEQTDQADRAMALTIYAGMLKSLGIKPGYSEDDAKLMCSTVADHKSADKTLRHGFLLKHLGLFDDDATQDKIKKKVGGFWRNGHEDATKKVVRLGRMEALGLWENDELAENYNELRDSIDMQFVVYQQEKDMPAFARLYSLSQGLADKLGSRGWAMKEKHRDKIRERRVVYKDKQEWDKYVPYAARLKKIDTYDASRRQNVGGGDQAIVEEVPPPAELAASEPVITPEPLKPESSQPSEQVPPEATPGKAIEASRTYNDKHYFEGAIPDGFKDLGRRGQIQENGEVQAGIKEILVVNRETDSQLAAMIGEVKREVLNKSPEEAALLIAQRVYKRIRPNLDYKYTRGSEVNIGEVEDGVCRHGSLLFQVLATEAGVKSVLRRGVMDEGSEKRHGLHVWNEIEVEEHRYVVDIMNPPEELRKKGFGNMKFDEFKAAGGFWEVAAKDGKQVWEGDYRAPWEYKLIDDETIVYGMPEPASSAGAEPEKAPVSEAIRTIEEWLKHREPLPKAEEWKNLTPDQRWALRRKQLDMIVAMRKARDSSGPGSEAAGQLARSLSIEHSQYLRFNNFDEMGLQEGDTFLFLNPLAKGLVERKIIRLARDPIKPGGGELELGVMEVSGHENLTKSFDQLVNDDSYRFGLYDRVKKDDPVKSEGGKVEIPAAPAATPAVSKAGLGSEPVEVSQNVPVAETSLPAAEKGAVSLVEKIVGHIHPKTNEAHPRTVPASADELEWLDHADHLLTEVQAKLMDNKVALTTLSKTDLAKNIGRFMEDYNKETAERGGTWSPAADSKAWSAEFELNYLREKPKVLKELLEFWKGSGTNVIQKAKQPISPVVPPSSEQSPPVAEPVGQPEKVSSETPAVPVGDGLPDVPELNEFRERVEQMTEAEARQKAQTLLQELYATSAGTNTAELVAVDGSRSKKLGSSVDLLTNLLKGPSESKLVWARIPVTIRKHLKDFNKNYAQPPRSANISREQLMEMRQAHVLLKKLWQFIEADKPTNRKAS